MCFEYDCANPPWHLVARATFCDIIVNSALRLMISLMWARSFRPCRHSCKREIFLSDATINTRQSHYAGVTDRQRINDELWTNDKWTTQWWTNNERVTNIWTHDKQWTNFDLAWSATSSNKSTTIHLFEGEGGRPLQWVRNDCCRGGWVKAHSHGSAGTMAHEQPKL